MEEALLEIGSDDEVTVDGHRLVVSSTDGRAIDTVVLEAAVGDATEESVT